MTSSHRLVLARRAQCRSDYSPKAEKQAAFLKDIKAHVTTKHARRAVSLWDESRVWDPGD